MRDTPRTDSEAGFVGTDFEFYKDKELKLYVPVEFARMLESELIECKENSSS